MFVHVLSQKGWAAVGPAAFRMELEEQDEQYCSNEEWKWRKFNFDLPFQAILRPGMEIDRGVAINPAHIVWIWIHSVSPP
jgi:hypothetical protein